MTAPIHPPARIALIGLGNMGVPMGARLLAAGYRVTGVDLSAAARERFAAAGGETEAEAAIAVAAADVTITLLPDGRAVREVAAAILGRLRPGAVMVDMSSSDPVGTRNLGEILAAAGIAFADAPVSGGVKRAREGTLAIMAGGPAEVLDRIGPVLAAMGRTIFRTGGLGSGHAMKALNNYVSAAGLVATVEAVAIGRRFGLDPELMAEVLNASTGRNNTTELKLRQFILSEAFNSGFPLRLMAKDVRIADELAHAIGVPSPLADACARIWSEAAASLEAHADHTEVGRHIERLTPRAIEPAKED